jgi:NodT family efflux transporter outer membrane factor (OMF) lipoprotein
MATALQPGRCALLFAILAAASLAGCVGPNFVRPAPPEVDGYLPGKLASPNPGAGPPHVAAQHFVSGGEIAARWWAAFRSTTLDGLIREAVAHNPSLQSAEAAIKVAQYNALAQRGLYFPQVTGNTTASPQLLSNDVTSDPSTQTSFTLYTHQLTVNFVPDIWGGNFRAVESLDAITEQQLFQLEAVFLTLTSNVVTAAIQEASLRGQIAATQRIIDIVRASLGILNRQFGLGQVAKADVLAEEAALAQAEGTLPPLQRQLAQQRDLLTALVGRYSIAEIEPKFTLSSFRLPANVPVSLPSKLVDQRPDVRAAEANMHSASALIGVAITARLPNITLSANGGTSAYKLAETFTPGTGFYTLAASVTQPLFDGFTLYNKQKAAEAALEQADAQYRTTVIIAFQNVADALRGLQTDARAVRAAVKSEDAAKASLDVVQSQLAAGQVSQLALLNAQQTYLTASIVRVQAEANRLADTVALFMALGGGWPAACTTPIWRECALGDDRS